MDLLSPPILSRYQFKQYIKPILPLHTYSAHTSSGYPSFSVLITFSPWEAWIWQSPTFPGSPCSSHAELSFETNSWACVHVYQLGSYLVFLSQLASAPLGVLFAWEHKGSPGARPQTLHIVYTCIRVCFSEEHLLPGVVALYCGIAPVCLLVSCIYTLPLVGYQQSTPDTWYRQLIKKKNKANPKAQLKMCVCVCVQNPTAYPKQTHFYHNTMILSWKHFYVIFISPLPYASAGSPHPGALSLTERQILLLYYYIL